MQQYIDFFRTHRQQIDESCAPALNSFREKAFDVFRKTGFPPCPSEDYLHTDVAALLKDDFGFFLNPPGRTVDPHKAFRCNVVNLNAIKHFIVNGYLLETKDNAPLPQGVFSGSLHVFARQRPELFLKYYNRLAGQEEDGLAAFNTLFVQDGYVLYVPENVILENTVQLTGISGGSSRSLINRRILVILEAGAQAKLLLCDHTSDEKSAPAVTQVVEVYAGENAHLDFYELEESAPEAVRLTGNYIRQAAASRMITNSITLSNGFTRNNYRIDLAGRQAETRLYGMAIADARQKIDTFTRINHLVPECRSSELFKYILDDEATGAFCGKIIVSPDAQRTEAYQNNRNLLGSRNCRMYSKPQLEIYADDVKCSHGMTTGQLDEAALFYMRSRGIPADEAALLLKFAFTSDVIQGIRLEGLRDRLKLLIEKRFRGELIKCQGCI